MANPSRMSGSQLVFRLETFNQSKDTGALFFMCLDYKCNRQT